MKLTKFREDSLAKKIGGLVTCGTVALIGTPNSARASLKCMTFPLPALGLLMR
jgi:hypothetical protein